MEASQTLPLEDRLNPSDCLAWVQHSKGMFWEAWFAVRLLCVLWQKQGCEWPRSDGAGLEGAWASLRSLNPSVTAHGTVDLFGFGGKLPMTLNEAEL